MSVYRPKGQRIYIYDFWYKGERFRDSTYQDTLTLARDVETQRKAKLKRQAGGVLRSQDTPRFSEWAGVFYRYCEHDLALQAPQHVMDTLRVVLRFWGAKTPAAIELEPNAPYHDLRLADPIEDPEWIPKFEAWIAERGRTVRGAARSAQSRNHYFSMMSRLYRCALLPQYRKHTGVHVNPFLGIPKKRTVARQVTLTPDQIRAWIAGASYHIRLAVAIAALAPKLRVTNVLALEWATHLDPALTRITLAEHKTARTTGLPMTAPISGQLREILLDARRRDPHNPRVVTYRGQAIKDITGGVAEAMRRAGITYGRDVAGGATFHTLRHSMATMLADLNEADAKRAAIMGQDPATTAKYTHLRVVGQQDIAERLSAALPIADLVTAPHTRARHSR